MKINFFPIALGVLLVSGGVLWSSSRAEVLTGADAADRAVSIAVNQAQHQGLPADSLQPLNQSAASQTSAEELFKKYRSGMEKRIYKNWKPPAYSEKKKSVVRFLLDRQGRLLNMTVLESSGVPALDQSAQDAVIHSAPFKHLPKKFQGDQMPFEFTFEYTPPGQKTVEPQPASESPGTEKQDSPQ